MRKPVAKSAIASSSPSDCHDRLGLGDGGFRRLAAAGLVVATALTFGRMECCPPNHHFLSSISTRRFIALPSGVLLLATKLPAPR